MGSLFGGSTKPFREINRFLMSIRTQIRNAVGFLTIFDDTIVNQAIKSRVDSSVSDFVLGIKRDAESGLTWLCDDAIAKLIEP